MMKSYRELLSFSTFKERYEYLRLNGIVAQETFGYERCLNQTLYRSKEWKSFRQQIIIRDYGCDLALDGYTIYGKILIHHLNPITVKDVTDRSSAVFDPDNVVCVSFDTHNAIHYGDASLLITLPPERTKNDTCPWKRL